MKRSVLTVVVSVLFTGFLFLSSYTAQAQMVPREAVKNLVVKTMTYPESAIDKKLQGEVVVSFILTKEGNLEVKEIFSRIPELRDHVYKTISSLEVPPTTEEMNEPIVLRFIFKLI